MTADKKPFFAGTYIPKLTGFGRLGFIDLCRRIGEMWRTEPQRILAGSEMVIGHVADAFAFEKAEPEADDTTLLDETARQISGRYDTAHGGFEGAPKFPTPHRLDFLLRTYERNGHAGLLKMVCHTLTAMRQGGLWDHVGFGFHRYSTDREWLLPHFEKMLYDQALLVPVYLRAFKLTGDPLFAQTVSETLNYVLTEMTSPQGGFYTAQDADSEGVEGKFYIWSAAEFSTLAAQAGKAVDWSKIFNVRTEGNFFDEATQRQTGENILHMTEPLSTWAAEMKIDPAALATEWERLRLRLYRARQERIPPLKDDKILADWNGLMIAALAEAGQQLNEGSYLDAARTAARFVMEILGDGKSGLYHRHRNGQSAIAATANDYAFVIMGLIALHRADRDSPWLNHAVALQHRMDDAFADKHAGGYFLTAADGLDLPVRPKELYDGALPSSNAVALCNLADLAELTADGRWREAAHAQIRSFAGSVQRQPMAYTQTLIGRHRWMDVLKTG
jgi:uncharacterized protein YyaL (SSP411 family)